jgi:hypothetical protein
MNAMAPINPRATATAMAYGDICESSGGWGSGVGVGCGDGVGDGVGFGLGSGVGLGDVVGEGVVVGDVSESAGSGAGETSTVTRKCVFPFETVIVCVPTSAAGTVTVWLKYPALSTVAVSK